MRGRRRPISPPCGPPSRAAGSRPTRRCAPRSTRDIEALPKTLADDLDDRRAALAIAARRARRRQCPAGGQRLEEHARAPARRHQARRQLGNARPLCRRRSTSRSICWSTTPPATASSIARRRAPTVARDIQLNIAGTVLALLLSALVAWALARRIIGPVAAASNVAERIAGGKLDVAIPRGSADELGALLGVDGRRCATTSRR